MDQNEIATQLANNPQMLAQILQTIQQNGMMAPTQPPQRQPMNWNMPTNPMAAVCWNNMMNMNNQNNQVQQPNVQSTNQVQQENNQSEQKIKDDELSIRIIKSPDDISIAQIPMGDKISLFLQDDMSIIYGKQWTNDGEIKNLRFVLEGSEQNNVKTSDNTETNNQTFNIEELMAAVGNIVNTKLEEFKKEYLTNDNYNQSKNRNNERRRDNGK